MFADPSRGIEALKKHGILERLANLVLCTDRHSTYFNADVLTHQFCLVHLIRNLQYLNDINETQQWSRDMQKLFREAIREANKAEAPPGAEVRKKYEERLDELLDQDVGHYGKDFQTLQNGIIKCRDFLFTFLDHEGVPHHNNASEAAIRILKVKTKVSGGFRTQDGADEFAVFHSIGRTRIFPWHSPLTAIATLRTGKATALIQRFCILCRRRKSDLTLRAALT